MHIPFSLKSLFAVSATTALVLTTEGAIAATFNPAPLFDSAGRYSVVNPINDDPTDIYFPTSPDLTTNNESFPLVLLLQGGLVDKSFYSDYASLVARYGFVVVVPNSSRFVNPPGITALIPDLAQVNDVLTHMTSENASATSPIAGRIDLSRYGLLGHSLGAATALSAIGDLCLARFFCEGDFDRPSNLLAGAFFGANLRDPITNEYYPIANDGIAVALIQGDRDGRALPFRAELTYNNVQTPPKALITLAGVNHFGITNVNTPAGSIPDPIAQTVPQSVAIETTARWSALFLRANMLEDEAAANYIYFTGDARDPIASVVRETVPEPATWLGLSVVSILLSSTYRQRKSSY
jgi:dienelactone hydrolase